MHTRYTHILRVISSSAPAKKTPTSTIAVTESAQIAHFNNHDSDTCSLSRGNFTIGYHPKKSRKYSAGSFAGSNSIPSRDTDENTSAGYAPPSSRTANITAKDAIAATLRSITSMIDPTIISTQHNADSIADTVSFFVVFFIETILFRDRRSTATDEVSAAAFAQAVRADKSGAHVAS